MVVENYRYGLYVRTKEANRFNSTTPFKSDRYATFINTKPSALQPGPCGRATGMNETPCMSRGSPAAKGMKSKWATDPEPVAFDLDRQGTRHL